METLKTVQVKQVSVYHYTQATTPAITGWYNRLIDKAEKTRFALMVMLMLIGTCMGSVAMAYLGFNAEPWQMALVVIPAILSNTFMIAQSSMKLIIPVFVLSMVMSIAVTFASI